MISAADTNVLLDVLIPGALVICEVVYAELSAQFPSGVELDGFLAAVRIGLEPSTPESLLASGDAWRKYSRTRKAAPLRCPNCGAAHSSTCKKCGRPIPVRQHVLADFLVGGHALTQADRLLTRDLGYYKTYFPTLKLV